MEKIKDSSILLIDINYFLEKVSIHINNTEHILELIVQSKELIQNKGLLSDINIFENNLHTFHNNVPKEYFINIDIIKLYLQTNYHDWLVDQIVDNSTIKSIEFLMDSNSENLNTNSFEKINNSIKNIYLYFNQNSFLAENEEKALTELIKYIKSPIISSSNNIKILFENIKNEINTKTSPENKEKTNLVESIQKKIKDDIEEKIDPELPQIINNLYNYFSKLFNRKRIHIEHTEIKTLQKITKKVNTYLLSQNEFYGELIIEQFQHFEISINKLYTKNIKEFKEEEVKEIFENLIIILREISVINKRDFNKN